MENYIFGIGAFTGILAITVVGFYLASRFIHKKTGILSDKLNIVDTKFSYLQLRQQLARELDDLLENSTRFGYSIETTISGAITKLENVVPGTIVRTRTLDEHGDSLELGLASGWPVALSLEILDARAKGEVTYFDFEDGHCLYRCFDMVDEHLGVAAMWLPTDYQESMPASEAAATLEDWVEVIDNFLAAKALSRRKHIALTQISDALKHPILEHGIDAAVKIFADAAQFDDLLLVCQSDDVLDRHTTCFRIFEKGELKLSSITGITPEMVSTIERVARNPSLEGLESLGLHSAHWVKAPLLDAMDAGLAGLVVVGSHTPILPLQEQLADRFADYLRQRVVDFSKEFEALSNTFPPAVVSRLLKEQDYNKKYLSPRERDVAILYADLSGFTYVSEQVLVEPAIIAKLMDTWGYEVVQMIWDTGGVFDKMVGDCVIALWGPPFYEMSKKDASHACIEAAKRIRAYTNSLASSGLIKRLEHLDEPLGVSIGLNYAPLFIGHLGPGQDFTGFSSGMNNTARLQGLAHRDQILCMEPFVAAYDDDNKFGEQKRDTVKNVSEPLKYRTFLDGK